MKKHKIFIIVIILLMIISQSTAQKGNWTIGFNSGLRGELFQGSELFRMYSFGNKISFPSLEFNVGYGINDNFIIETGISYIETKTNWLFGAIDWGMEGTNCDQYKLYTSLQLPINFKYYLPLFKNRFQFFTKVGLNIQVPLQAKRNQTFNADPVYMEYNGYSYKLDYDLYVTSPSNPVNVLISTGIGCNYRFKSGIGLSLFGEYYTGLRNMATICIPYTLVNMDTGLSPGSYEDEYLTYRGDYWNVGLGISYTFQKKSQ
ncbi:MAG: hypothetical protein PHI52_10455 [Bacteroidales bacterium]|nr:hypothetical protein [Bacteroidales bacterium]